METLELKQKANEIRRLILEMVYQAKSGHLGGSLSAADIFTCLYGQILRIDPQNPKWKFRDRFVLSKGHATPAYYASLAEFGFFPKDELRTFRRLGSRLQGHPDCKHTPGVDMSSGSLGQGISTAVGMAFAAKMQGLPIRVYVMLGDGEMEEGQVWEALMFAGNRKLDNLVIIIDNNDLQCDGHLDEVNSPNPIDEKLQAFHFQVKTVDGHNMKELVEAFGDAKKYSGVPFALIAKTVKGKGVSFMEDQAGWHGKVPDTEQFKQAMRELESAGAALCSK